MAGNIFVSYRRDDAPGQARAIQLALERTFGSSRVFMDIGGIEPGEDFADKLVRTLGRCKAMVVVIGPSWLPLLQARAKDHFQSTAFDFVRMEIADALRQGKAVIPVLVGGARMPDQMELYGELMQLARHQAIEIRETHFPSDAAELVKVLERIVGRRRRWRTSALAASSIGLALIGGGAAWLHAGGGVLPSLRWPMTTGAAAPGAGQVGGTPGRSASATGSRPAAAECSYEPFRDAASPGGAATALFVESNTTRPCQLAVVDARGVPPSGLAVRRPARWGEVKVLSHGVISYLPPKDFVGLDHFAIHSASQSYAVAVMVRVGAAGQAKPRTTFLDTNAACVVQPFRGAAMPGGSATVMTVRSGGASCLIRNYPRPGQPPLDLEIVRPPRQGGLVLPGDGVVIYKPRAGFSGRDSFAYRSPSQPFAMSVNVVVIDGK